VAACPLVLLPFGRLFVAVAAADALDTAADGVAAWSSRTTAHEQPIEFRRTIEQAARAVLFGCIVSQAAGARPGPLHD
jgi:hypothetical protein